ncbi:thiosulfate oxidation carrier protein SoxY [Thiohalorhabdus methylotrophus]|uniref:Thiosulfate oxidation carrier protein SoxY n=1 Tax=Thiohalorhabdus methylotrophus TaxID=3242694 RepID=A0ABV4TRI8_9GAMM
MRVANTQNTGRRSFLKTLGTTGAVVAAAGAGLLKPVKSLAANFPFPKEAFNQESMDSAMQTALGTTDVQEGHVSLKTPTIAENGAVVPITASSDLEPGKVAKFHIFVTKNPAPYTARFHMLETGRPEVSTRIKMNETSDIVAVAETTDGQFYKTSKEVRVTIGGCGG